MRVLALDFDGVVSDSAPEAFRVALRAYQESWPGSGLDPDAPPASLYPRFLELMPLGNRAEDYAVILAAILAGAEIGDQADYDAFHRALDQDDLRAFHRNFYRERAAWAEAAPADWQGHMQVYPGITDLLRRRAGDVVLAIATAKDRHSVRKLLRAYGIDDLFPEGRVLDKETGVHKSAHITHLCRELGVPPSEVTFVDDKLNHLEKVAALGARCVLAAWGYNGEREARGARAAGHLVCTLADLEAALFPALPPASRFVG